MSTVDKAFADKIVAANGILYPNDGAEPHVISIVEYDNAWGGVGYGVTFEGQDPNTYLSPTEYIRNPRIYWKAE